MCNGIKSIHDLDLVHRDLKTQNIFKTESLEIKIGDFGLAKIQKSGLEEQSFY